MFVLSDLMTEPLDNFSGLKDPIYIFSLIGVSGCSVAVLHSLMEPWEISFKKSCPLASVVWSILSQNFLQIINFASLVVVC